MTQTNRSRKANERPRRPNLIIAPIFLIILLSVALLTACNATVGAGGRTGTTHVGGSVGSTGSVVGIGNSVGPGLAVSTYRDTLHNGPRAVRNSHKAALDALKKGNHDTAATIFETTLKNHPEHPDATYYLGLVRIYQERRDEGFALLKSYRDPDYYRMTTAVQRTAKRLEQNPDLSPEKVHDALNRERNDGYNRDVRERRDMFDWD